MIFNLQLTNKGVLRLTSNRVISVELWLRVRVNDYQYPVFKILDCQNPEKGFWQSKILNLGFWQSKILNSGFDSPKS